jgi:hypothetical protein
VTRRSPARAGRGDRTPRCARCGGADLSDPAPVRTSAHPNSSSVLVETPGAHFHDHPVQAVVCLGCGAVDLSLSPATLEAFRSEARPGRSRRRP